uniref:Nudix hydrolase domain-containing protein n=1 Tax=Cucumis sativus TaxID=3659 RepID=A0A0A0K671_CUCSA
MKKNMDITVLFLFYVGVGDYNRAVHVWIFAESTQELLLQLRSVSNSKESWPGLWNISTASQIAAGDSSLVTARRKLQKELGVILPKDAFEMIFDFLPETVRITNGDKFKTDVYLVTTLDPIPLEAFTLQESEVSAVKYIHYLKYKSLLGSQNSEYVPYDVDGQYGQLFDILTQRYALRSIC